jgi:RNA polymerase sigma-70 factor (ECF subfamily)
VTPTADQIASLYDRLAPEVLRYLARRTWDPETAVDLTSETFARAIADRRRFRGHTEDELIGWIYAIARNQLTDFLRRGRVEREAMSRLGMQRRPLPDADFDRIEQLFDLQSVRDEVAAALEDLPEPQRHVLRLRVLEEQSYGELAVNLGTSEQTARARVSRALRALRGTPAFTRLGEERCV